jgi:RHS repeat-associated protein
VLDRNQIALVFDGQGVQKSRYLYGTQVDQVLAEESGTQVRWFLADHQGTIKDVIDNAGAVIDHITYDSFGQIIGQTNPIDLRFAYTGREWDGETGQYYYRARYYDPADGRFISEDPIGFNGEDSNLSRYIENNSVNFIDPYGNRRMPVAPPQRNPNPTRPGGWTPNTRPGGDNPNTRPNPFPKPGGGNPGTGTPGTVPQNPNINIPGYDVNPNINFRNINPDFPTTPVAPTYVDAPGQDSLRDNPLNNIDRSIFDQAVDPNNCPEDKRKKECKKQGRRILYRGDDRKPHSVFETGFTPKGSNTDLFRYVENNVPSIFVGTSKEFPPAARYATKAPGKVRKPGFVYTICDPGGGIDVNDFYAISGKVNRYERDLEIAFPGSISTRDIRGVIRVNATMEPIGSEVLNPYYK